MNHSNIPATRADALSQILLLSVLALLLWFAGNIRQKYRPRPAKQLPISRRQIERIAYQKRMLWHIPPCALIVILMGGLCFAGRMGPGEAFTSALIALLIPAWSLYLLLFLQRRPLKSVPESVWAELERQLSEEQLQRIDGAWQFSSMDWYIRVGEQVCVVLCAGQIDFSVPVRRRVNHIWSQGFKTGHIRIRSEELLFAGKGASLIRAHTTHTPQLQKWIKNHGGRFE